MPSNEGRGYVLRRIMRRGMRHAQLLGARDPLMYRMVPTLLDQMGKAYPELIRAEALITETLQLEEDQLPPHARTAACSLLDEETAGCRRAARCPATTAFKLYDTFGFPLDLTQDALRARGLTVDLAGFDAAMAAPARRGARRLDGLGRRRGAPIWFDAARPAGADRVPRLRHDADRAPSSLALVVDGRRSTRGRGRAEVAWCCPTRRPSTANSGGQIGDTGTIRGRAAVVTVTDTQKRLGDLFVHVGTLEAGR